MERALSFPFRVTELGTAHTSPRGDVVRQQLEQLLLTVPGERVNRPDFGCGIQRLVFAGADPATLAAAEYIVASSVRRHLRALVALDAVRVTVDQTSVYVDILYTLVGSGEESSATFVQPLEVAP